MIFRIMIVAGVANLKAKLSEYLGRVQAGDDVLVTDHGRPIARIVSVKEAGEELVELERKGLLRAGAMRIPREFLEASRPHAEGAAVTQALLEERREGR